MNADQKVRYKESFTGNDFKNMHASRSSPVPMLNNLIDYFCRYSDKCYPVTHIKQFMNANFIRLHCISTSLPTFGDVVSREFFANVRPDAKARSKMKKWVAIKSKEDRPPSIIILGVDTVSRLNSLRNFKKSLSVLRSIGAIEMKGYTKGNNYSSSIFAF